jgi:hypothetical protein
VNHLRSRLSTATAAAALAGGLLVVGAAPVMATPPDVHKVTICHATASQDNPYLQQSVDIASSGSDEGQLQGGHAGHTGAVWYQGIVGKWGDIIPPYDYAPTGYHFDGLNWDADGQAIYRNDCLAPQSESQPASLTLTTEIHLGATDAGEPTVVDDGHPAADGATVHDSARLSFGDATLPDGSTVSFFFWTSHDCSGEPVAQSDPIAVSGTSPASVDPGLVEADLSSGDYSFQATFASGDVEAMANASSDCEPFVVLGGEVAGETSPPSETSSPGKTGLPNTATLGTGDPSSPSNSTWLFVAALGVLLASVVILRPAGARARR